MRSILLMSGPNLDMLGTREPEIYGSMTLAELEGLVAAYAAERGIALSRFQSNSEGTLIDALQLAQGQFDGIVYNPGAHTHYSYALRDAIGSISTPVVEVHLSDIDDREPFRRISVIAPACVAQVKGMGVEGYYRAIDILCRLQHPVRLAEGFEVNFPEGRSIKIAALAPGAVISENEGEPEIGQPACAGEGEDGNNRAEPEHAGASGDGPDTAQPELSCEDAGESRARIRQLREACKPLGVDSFLVRDTSNIRWLTAFDGVFDEERAHALLVTPDGAYLHTDSRYSNALRARASQSGGNVQVNDERIGHMKFARRVLADGAHDGRLAIEDTITYAEYVKAVDELGIGALAASTDTVLGLRAVKTPGEIKRLMAAQAIADDAFRYIVGIMRPGMTEREVQLALEDYMLRHGAEGLAFPSIVACGPNGADPHAIPGQARLEAGQCVVIDFGARLLGYCSDTTRTVFLGQPSARMLQAWEVLRRANEAVEGRLRPGMTGKQAHELAEQVLSEGGFAGCMGHGLGHGVGLDVHELPVLNTRNEQPLVQGNVVTVEPGIYLPGEFGMRLEDCGVVTEDGFSPFTQLDHEMVVL